MGEVYDQPRETLTREQVDRSLRYQIMEVVDRIRWIPDFGYERELDWLRNMHDWMISKKRYWGLALPIYECAGCGTVTVVSGRDELQARAIDGWDRFDGHTPHRPWVDEVRIACSGCGQPVSRIPDVGNVWLDAGIVPYSTLHYREDPESGRSGSRLTSSRRASPASSATGSTRCWRCPRSSAARSRSGRSSAMRRCWPRTAGRCTRAPATPSSSTRRPTGWASTSCAGSTCAPDPTTTSCSAGGPLTRHAASCWSSGTCTPSS